MTSKGLNTVSKSSQAHSNIESYLTPSELGKLGSTSTQKKIIIRKGNEQQCKPRYHGYHKHFCDEIQTRAPNQPNVRYICCKDEPILAEFYADRLIRLFPSLPDRPDTYKILFLNLWQQISNSQEDFKQYIHFDQDEWRNNTSISNLILNFLRNVLGKVYISNKRELTQLIYYLHTRGESYNPESRVHQNQEGGFDIFNLYKSSKVLAPWSLATNKLSGISKDL